MTRSQSVVSVLVAALILAGVAYLVPPPSPGSAAAAETPPEDVSWLPDGLELKEPEMAYGIDGTLRDFNVRLSEDVRPADNAAVLLVQAFGADTFESVLRGASLDMLGIRRLADAPRFLYMPAYVQSHRSENQEAEQQLAALEEAFQAGSERPWARDDYPNLAEYLDANAAALDLVVAAGDRPRYYAPLLSMEDPMRLMSAAFSVEFRMPYLGRCLTARAMSRFAAGDAAAATADLVACHKLAALLGQGSPLDISCAKAHMLDALASHAEIALLTSGKLQPEHAAVLLEGLKAAPEVPTCEDAANRGERAMLHQELELLRTDEDSRQGFFETGSPDDLQQLEKLAKKPSLFKLMLDSADAQHDKIVQALSIQERAEQLEAIAVLDQEFAQWSEGDGESDLPFAELARQNPEEAARSIGHSMAMALRPNGWQRRFTDDRARLRRDSSLVAAALLAYRARHGSYPAALSDLAPKYLAEVPDDVFSGNPFEYQRRSDDNVVFSSLGANQINDDGSIYNDDLFVELD